MTYRIHRYLDGDLPSKELTEEERREAEEYRRVVDQAVPLLRAERSPDLLRQVMRRISPAPHKSLQDRVLWLWTPRTVSLRPAWGIFAAAALLLLFLLPRAEDGSRGSIESAVTPSMPAEAPTAAASSSPPTVTVFVQFRLEAAEAFEVRLAGTFTGWKPQYTLHQTSPGTWSVLVPLPPGVHDYAFVVDGERWMPDPAAPGVDDGFGGRNSRLALLPTNGERES